MSLLGIPVLEGRDFDAGDDENSERVIILSRLAAARLFPEGSAVGRTV